MFKKNAFAILLAGTLLASCGPAESTTDTVLVSFSVGDEIVYTEDLGAEGGIPENYAYEPEAGELVYKKAFAKGLAWVPSGHILRLAPQLIMEDEVAMRGLDIIEEAIAETEKELC